jgi:hypothetical protein
VEIEKVISFTGDETVLSRDEIEQVMSTTAPTSIFDSWMRSVPRDCRDAMRLFPPCSTMGSRSTVYTP